MKGSGVLGAFLQQEEATKILACQIPVSFLSCSMGGKSQHPSDAL